MPDERRERCKQWLAENGLLEYNEYTQEELNNTGLMDSLLAFAQAERAAGLREAAKYANTLPVESSEKRRVTASIADWCERRAQERDP